MKITCTAIRGYRIVLRLLVLCAAVVPICASAAPEIALYPASLTYTGQVYSTLAPHMLTVSNSGDADLSYTISSATFWLSISNPAGVLAAGQATQHTVMASSRGLDARSWAPYSGRLTITAPSATNSPADLDVALSLVRDEAPHRIVGWGDGRYGQTNIPSGLTNAPALSCGAYHAVALVSDGSLLAWGSNSLGQLDVPAGLLTVLDVSAGAEHNLALQSNGLVVAWGDNNRGQTNVPQSLLDAVAVKAGSEFSLALKSNGTMVGWGDNQYGQRNIPAGLSNVVSFAAGGYHTLALRSNGRVVAWGYNGNGQTNVPASLSNVVGIAAGREFSVALKADGTVVAWGQGDSDQTSVPAGLSNVVSLSAGGDHVLALIADGTCVAWGDDTYGQASVPSAVDYLVKHIACGNSHSLALLGMGTVDLTVTSTHGLPSPGIGTNWVASNSVKNCSVASPVVNGATQFVCTGWTGTGSIPASGSSNQLSALLVTDSTLQWLWATQFLLSVHSANGGMIDRSGGWYTGGSTVMVTAVSDLGYAFSGWVGDTNGCVVSGTQLTVPMTQARSLRAQFSGTQVVSALESQLTFTGQVYSSCSPLSITVSNSWTGALTYTISPSVFWLSCSSQGGTLASGQAISHSVTAGTRGLDARHYEGGLDIQTPISTNSIMRVAVSLDIAPSLPPSSVIAWGEPVDGITNVPSDMNIIALSGGQSHALGLRADRTVVAWGGNPVEVFIYEHTTIPSGLSNVVDVQAGDGASTVLQADGTVVSWGNDGFGQADVPLDLQNVVDIAGKGSRTLALQADGNVRAWGGGFGYSVTAVPSGLVDVVSVSDGGIHALALRANGSVLAWSYDADGPVTDVVPDGLTNIVAVSSGLDHMLALRADGSVMAWGDNYLGQTNVPPGLSDVVAISAGGYHSLALRADGSAVTWGWEGTGNILANIPTQGMNVASLEAGLGEYSLAILPNSRLDLVVASAHGDPLPQPGTNRVLNGSEVQCTVTSVVNNAGTQFLCRGWIGTGSVPASGETNSVTFTITNNSSITWLWETNVIYPTRYVSPFGSHEAPFTNWVTAATTLQAAVDVSVAGDVVLVTNGTYSVGSRVASGGTTNRLVIDKAVRVQSVNGAPETIIRGGAGCRVVWMTNGASLIGFTIQEGEAVLDGTNGGDGNGGGVYAWSNAVVSNCTLLWNVALNEGGGLYGGRALRCRFGDNFAMWGGGAANAELYDSHFAGNVGYVVGAVSSSLVVNCTILNNWSDDGSFGGVVDSIVNNSIVRSNNTSEFYLYFGRESHRYYSFEEWSSSFQHSFTFPLPDGTNNSTNYPGYVSWGNPRLLGAAAAIDAGANMFVESTVDLDGRPRLAGSAVDVGCYEYTGTSTGSIKIGISSPDGIVVPGWGARLAMLQAGQVSDYYWDFGDGTRITNLSPLRHSWSTQGIQTVQLVAWNDTVSVTSMVTICVTNPTVYVSLQGSHESPFMTWETAATNIQAAVDVCLPGGHVVVTDGVYSVGGRCQIGSMSNRVLLARPLRVESVNGPDYTIIQGGTGVRGAWLTNGAALVGFTVTGGTTLNTGDVLHDQSGGGVFGSRWGTISNCVIEGNSAVGYGGGLNGGTGFRCVVRANQCGMEGGGAYWSEMFNSLIYSNFAETGGGFAVGTAVNCTILGNSASDCGGADEVAAFNCIVRENHSETNPDRDNFDSSWNLRFSCSYPNSTSSGSFTNDPMIVSIREPYLLPGSPCIDVGTNGWPAGIQPENWVSDGMLDLFGRPRLNGDRVDVGCVEFWPNDHLNALVIVSSHGTTTPPAGTNSYPWGSMQICSINPVAVTNGGTQFVNIGWIGTGSVPASGISNSVSFAITNNSSILWRWQTNYFLNVSASSNGIPSSTNRWYAAGTSVTITAVPNSGFAFVAWSGDTNGSVITGAVITLPMSQARAVHAQFFESVGCTLVVATEYANPSPSEGSHFYESGSTQSCSVSTSLMLGNTQILCRGWIGTGSVPTKGSSNSVSFVITTNSSITWLWQAGTNQNLLLAANGGQLLSFTGQLSAANGAAKLNDGLRGSTSYWKSPTNPVGAYGFVWQFTNSGPAQLDRAVLYNYGQGDSGLYSKGYRLELSSDGTNYVVVTNAVLSSNEKAKTNSLTGQQARWVRLVITNGYKTKFWEFSELEVYGYPGLNAMPTGPVPPSVSITSPSNGTTVIYPFSITIGVSASDVDGVVTQVMVYGDGSDLGSDVVSPYEASWISPTPGNRQLWATAHDNEGLVSTSATVIVVVTQQQVNLLLPANGGQLLAFTGQLSAANGADKLTDGIKGQTSFWKSPTNPVGPYGFVWRLTNAGLPQLDRVVFYNYGEGDSGRYSKNYRLEVSSDGTNYSIVTNGVLASKTKAQTNKLSSISAGWVRLVVTNGYNKKFWELSEVEVYGLIPVGGGGGGFMIEPQSETARPLARLELKNGETTLSFDAVSQQLYSVDFKASMQDDWKPIIVDQPGTSAWEVITLPATNVSGFYRIRSRPVE